MLAVSWLLAACTPDTTPTWAFDPIWLEPALADAVYGFQTWELYGPKWIENTKPNTYACAVVTELEGAPIPCDADPGCTVAWEVTTAVVETDCPDPAIADGPLFLSLLRVGIGGPDGSPEAPWPGKTQVGWADYGNGWEVHGYAYPEALDLGGTVESGEWDGIQPFLMVPTQSFPLDSTASPGT